MFWAPNSAWAAVDQIVGGWTPYWPDPSTVDIVGLSYYHYGGHDRNNLMPDAGEAKQVLGEFDSLFGSGKGKPVVLAETAASYVSWLSCFCYDILPPILMDMSSDI